MGMASTKLARKFIVSGRVQGVGYRFFAERCANRLGVSGYVKNCWDGTVEVYAVGDNVVYPHKPPMPPLPWLRHDPMTERPFAPKDVPLVRDAGRTRIDNGYVPGRRNKALALGGGVNLFSLGAETADEAVREAMAHWEEVQRSRLEMLAAIEESEADFEAGRFTEYDADSSPRLADDKGRGSRLNRARA